MTAPELASAVRFGADGLVPAVVQDGGDGRVLMVAFVDAEALAATLSTGFVHFHSRSRGRLWKKGEESGNVLRLRELSLDCDGDALLLTVDATGPTCHRGTRSCFDDPSPHMSMAAAGGDDAPSAAPTQNFAWLEELWRTIADRAARRPGSRWTPGGPPEIDIGADARIRTGDLLITNSSPDSRPGAVSAGVSAKPSDKTGY